MANAILTWKLPSPTNRQRPLGGVRIESRVSDSLPWTLTATVAAPGEELVIEDIAPGDWFFRATVFDVDGRESSPVEAQTSVDFDPPSEVTDFSARIE